MADNDGGQFQAPAAVDWAALESGQTVRTCNQDIPEPVCTPARHKPIHIDPEFNYRRREQDEPFKYSKRQGKILGRRVSDRKAWALCSPGNGHGRKRQSSTKRSDVILLRSDEQAGERDADDEYEGENEFQVWVNKEFGDSEDEEGGEFEYEEIEDEPEDESMGDEEAESGDSEGGASEDEGNEAAVFTEAELRFLITELPQRKWASTFCLERILSILVTTQLDPEEEMAEEIAKDLESRLIILWKFYRRRSQSGILLHDVKILIDIVLILGEEFWEHSFAAKIVDRIERHYIRGIRIRRMGDKAYLTTLSELFTTIGQMIESPSQTARRNAISIFTKLTKATIRSKICSPKPPVPIPGRKESCDFPLQVHDFFYALELSYLPTVILQQLASSESMTRHEYSRILKIVCLMTDRSKQISQLALGFPIVEPMLMRLNSRGGKRSLKVLCQTVKVIYNMYANPGVRVEQVCFTMPCRTAAFRILLGTFLERTRMISSKLLINLRNDVAFVILLLVRHIPELQSAFEGYGYLIAAIVTANVFRRVEPDGIVLDGSSDDFEFLKILVWILKFVLDSDPQGEAICRMYSLVAVFMRLVMGPCDLIDTYAEHGETSDLDSMLNITWNCFSVIAHRFPSCFKDSEGIDAILDTLEIYAEHGKMDISLVALFLDTCRALLIQNDVPMVQYIDSKGGMEVFTKTLKQLTKTDWAMSDEPIISNALMCCALLSAHNEQQREIFMDNNGVKILLRLLNRLVYAPPHKRHMNSVIHISIAECIWQCLADSPSCLESFLLYEGMFRMLELLEIAAGPGAQLHILSCILELCEYPRCVDQLLYWKRRVRDDIQRVTHGQDFNLQGSSIATVQQISPGDKIGEVLRDQDLSLAALLCELWREEEERLGVKRDKEGVIASIKEPLMSAFAREYTKNVQERQATYGHPAEGNTNGPASLDLLNSIRPKIFLLAKKLTDATNTEATIYGGLSVKNQVTMQIITNMLDLKRGEIWLEVVDGFIEEGIQIVETDKTAIELFFKIAQNKVAVVIDTQRYLIRRAKEDAEMKERQFYNAIKICHLQDHLQALKEAEYHARTSNYFLLIDKRLWQKAQIQRAILNIDSNARIHRTTDDSLNVTAWATNRKKVIDSEPQFNTAGFDEEQAKREAAKYAQHIGPSDEAAEDQEDAYAAEADGVRKFKKHEYRFTSSQSMLRSSGGRGPLIPSQMKSANDTPEPGEGRDEGFYSVDPYALQKALLDYLKDLRRWDWKTGTDDPETAWSVRTKWRSDWYH